MTDDREMLKLAAKAAGVRLTWGEKFRVGDTEVDCTDLPYAVSSSPNESPRYWNPLDDDGDALRLAVRLGHRIDTPKYNGFGSSANNVTVFRDGCPFAQTRRAIVRAAAELGKSMP